MPRVSILVTCYNHLDYLPEAIAGIRAQTFTDYEIIAIDDGSSDGTREWLTAHLQPHEIIFNEQNLGTYGTLNRALEAAKGEFIAVLNDDDVWEPLKLERQVAMLDANPRVGLVHTDGIFIGPTGAQLEGNPLGFDWPRTETGNNIIPLIYANKIIASAVLVRRACFEDVGTFDAQYFGSGDWDMWLRIAEKWDVGYVHEPLTRYRWHTTNASKKFDKIWRDDERLRRRIESQMPLYQSQGLDPEALKKASAHNYACLGTVLKLNGKPAEARRAYGAAAKLAPGRWQTYLRYLATFLPREAFKALK